MYNFQAHQFLGVQSKFEKDRQDDPFHKDC